MDIQYCNLMMIKRTQKSSREVKPQSAMLAVDAESMWGTVAMLQMYDGWVLETIVAVMVSTSL